MAKRRGKVWQGDVFELQVAKDLYCFVVFNIKNENRKASCGSTLTRETWYPRTTSILSPKELGGKELYSCLILISTILVQLHMTKTP